MNTRQIPHLYGSVDGGGRGVVYFHLLEGPLMGARNSGKGHGWLFIKGNLDAGFPTQQMA